MLGLIMAKKVKYLWLCLVVILAISCIIMSESASSQSVPNPPEFTLKYVDHSYDVSPMPTSSTNPYTGETTTTTIPGYHVDNRTIDATITNNGASYYNFRYKGNYEQEWKYYPFYPDVGLGYFLPDGYRVPFQASTSKYTVLSLYFLPDIPLNGKIDVQVQGLYGYFRAVPYGHAMLLPGGPTYDFYFEGEAGNWSDTQTITISDESVSPFPSPTSPMPTINTGPHTEPFPIESVLVVVSILTVVFIVSLLYIGHLKRSVTKPDNSTV